MKILVVDDSMMSRRMLIDKLPQAAIGSDPILQGKNGLEGFELYKEHKPDIVFLDLTMPVMDGYEALEHIIGFDPNAFVVVVSADEQPKAVEKVLSLGAKRHISKNTSTDELVEIVQELIMRRMRNA